MSACAVEPEQQPEVAPVPTVTSTQGAGTASLRSLAARREVLIGTTVNMNALKNNQDYATTLAREFDLVTPEDAVP